MSLTTIPAPVVPWTTVVATSDPTREPTRAKKRTLKEKGLLSEGLHVQSRQGGRAAGSQTYHSALFALAIQAKQAGDEAGAKTLSRRGSAIEKRFDLRIRKFLTNHSLEELDEAPFYAALVAITEEAIEAWDRFPDVVFAIGRVHEVFQTSVVIEAKHLDAHFDVDLPRELLEQSGISQGDYVWLFRRIMGSAAVLNVLPAVSASTDEDARPAEIHTPRGSNRGGTAESADAQRYLTTGPGAQPTAAEAEFLLSLPSEAIQSRRAVRPAG
ncbi:hypothetical protein ACFPJ1_29250 [Kribbella qitaiheensis]|uniref:hypothetical protein n=1 Tax=Kribbella qitaiheensis TaxID=1544730 RepID=UPI003606F362